jgi:hypothetical protein
MLMTLGFGLDRAAYAAGKVELSNGSAVAINTAGDRRTLTRGDRIIEGDTLTTGKRSRLSVLFDDGSKFSLGSNTNFQVEIFKFSAKPANSDSMSFRLLRGAFRFVSGLLSKRKRDAVSLRLGAIATIGIRGTVVAAEFDGSAKIVLLEPEDPSRKTAIEVFNAAGSVLIDEPGYGTEVADANTAPTPPRRMRLRTVENLTRTIRNIGRSAPRVRR